VRQVNDITQCFNVQNSQWNSHGDSLSFTFNYGFYNKQIHDLAFKQESVIDFPKTFDCFIHSRLGQLSHNTDHWYVLHKKVDKNEISEQVKHNLDKYLLPIFEQNKSLTDLKSLVDSSAEKYDFINSPLCRIIYLMTTNQIEKGNELIRKEYTKALIPQVSKQTINYPNGRSVITYSEPRVNQGYIDNIKRLAKQYGLEINASC
jgi:hypothetical protein